MLALFRSMVEPKSLEKLPGYICWECGTEERYTPTLSTLTPTGETSINFKICRHCRLEMVKELTDPSNRWSHGDFTDHVTRVVYNNNARHGLTWFAVHKFLTDALTAHIGAPN